MKKRYVFIIVACVLVALVAVGVLVIGLGGRIPGLSFNGIKDLGKGTSAKLTQEYETIWENADEVHSLDISWAGDEVDVTIVPDGNTIRIVEFSDKELAEEDRAELYQSGGTLQIKPKSKLINFSFNRVNLLVEVPADVASKMREIEVNTASADVDIAAFECDNMKLSTASGDIELENAVVREKLTLSSVSGDIETEGTSSVELNISSTSGEISAERIEAKKVKLSTVSGEIEVLGKYDEITANSTSGEIDLTAEKMVELADLSSVSGELTLAIPENDGMTIEYSSVSGIFSTDFDFGGVIGKKKNTGVYKEGGANIEFSTTSGSMNLLRY